MAAINISQSQFEDIVVLFLLDKLTNSHESENVRFKNLMKALNKNGVKQYLYKYFLTTDSDSKVKYRQVLGVLSGAKKGQAAIIVTEDFVKDIVSKVVGKNNPNPKKLRALLEELS